MTERELKSSEDDELVGGWGGVGGLLGFTSSAYKVDSDGEQESHSPHTCDPAAKHVCAVTAPGDAPKVGVSTLWLGGGEIQLQPVLLSTSQNDS